MTSFAASVLNNVYTLSVLCFLLTCGPILGIWYIHREPNVRRR